MTVSPTAKVEDGRKLVVVACVTKPRELVYFDDVSKLTCTHLIVPGMVVERVHGRPLTSISIDMAMVAKHLNEMKYEKSKPVGVFTADVVPSVRFRIRWRSLMRKCAIECPRSVPSKCSSGRSLGRAFHTLQSFRPARLSSSTSGSGVAAYSARR